MPRKKQIQQEITIFFPNKISISDLKHEIMNDYNGKVSDISFMLFFHILSEEYFDFGKGNKIEFMQIHSDILKCIFHNEYKSIIEKLVSHEYIEIDNSYSHEQHICKSYRIHSKRIDLTKPFSFARESINGNFKRKLTTLRMIDLSTDAISNGYQHVIEQTANLLLVLNDEATEYIRQRYAKEGNPNPPEYYAEYFNSNPIKKTGIDKFGNRLHSVITNMPKVIRQCLRFKSSPLVTVRELAIVNSQPFFLSSVTSVLIAEFVPGAITAVPIFAKFENMPDVIKFRELCRDGSIYEFMRAAYEAHHGAISSEMEDSRTVTKKLMYGVLFGDYDIKDSTLIEHCKSDKTIRNKQFYDVYKIEFNGVYQLFKEIKDLFMSCTVNKKGERKTYANNCLIAQRLESGVIFNRIVPTVINEGYTELVTVHDCLIVRADEYDNISSIMQNVFSNLNLNPKIK